MNRANTYFFRRVVIELAARASAWALNGQGSFLFKDTGEKWFVENCLADIQTVVDVGLNRGDYTDIILSRFPHAKVLGVEPVTEFAGIAAARFPDNLVVENVLLSDREEVEHTIYRKGFGANSDPGKPEPGDTKIYEVIKSNSVTLDSLILKHGVAPDLVKIDTDGFDLRVLKGAVETVTKYRPIIQIEVGKFWAFTHSSHSELLSMIDDWRYRGYVLQRRGLMAVRGPEHLTSSKASFNLILLPKI